MSLRYGAGTPRPLPVILRRRAIEDARVRAHIAAMRRSAECGPACDHLPAPRPALDDTVLVPRIVLLAAVRLR